MMAARTIRASGKGLNRYGRGRLHGEEDTLRAEEEGRSHTKDTFFSYSDALLSRKP